MLTYKTTCVLLAVLVPLITTRQLPSFITPCKRNDPDLNKCYAKAINDLRPHMVKGVPELGIPPIDPLVIPRLELNQPDGASVGFDAVLTNVTLSGANDFELIEFKVNLDTGYFAMKLHFPRIKMLSDYMAKGRVLIVNFEGEGLAHGDFGDITVSAEWMTQRYKKNGKEHFKIISDVSKLDVKDISVQFDNLFRNNKEITDNTNKLINENKDVLYLEIKPIIERTIIELVNSVISLVNTRYSIDELYPL